FDTSESSDIEESAVLATEPLLPSKSKENYENAYRQFDNWCKEKRMRDQRRSVASIFSAKIQSL
ncbi:hypothetical protein BDFB_014944, partial [Asbolus verrucosus]